MSGVEQLLEVEVGRAQPATIGLSPGEPVGPLSIGRMGGWRIAANGVAAEHGWIYFDGTGLYLQSVDPQAPMYVDGQPVPTAWTPVHAPCTIALGAAKLSFIAAAEEIERTADKFPAPAAQSIAEPPRPPTPAADQPARPSTLASASRPFAPGELARRPDAEDSTRMGAIDVVAARARASALARPAATTGPAPSAADRKAAIGTTLPSATGPQPSSPFPASMASPVSIAPPAAAPTTPPPGPAPTLEKPTTIQEVRPPSGVMARWREASFAQKVTLFLLPLALASVYVIFTEPPAAEETDAGEPASDAGASESAAPVVSAAPSSAATIAAAPISATPGTIDAAPDVPAATTPTVAAAPATPPPVAVVARPGSAAQRTLERRAADSVAAGDWDGAAELYEQLARQHPDRPAFAEAARILRARAK